MRPAFVALFLLLAACSSSPDGSSAGTTTGATGTGGEAVGGGGMGAGGTGGDGDGAGVAVATSSASTGAGGDGGATTDVGGSGGSGDGGQGGAGGEAPWVLPCESAACEPFGLYCVDCGSDQTCEDHVCTDAGGAVPLRLGVGDLDQPVALHVPLIEPGYEHPTCEAVCGSGAAWAVRLELPAAGGCVTVDAPDGWWAATRPPVGDEPPRACPVASANQEACSRHDYEPGDHLVVWLREGEGSPGAIVWITATDEACPDEPVDCGPQTCNGEEQ